MTYVGVYLHPLIIKRQTLPLVLPSEQIDCFSRRGKFSHILASHYAELSGVICLKSFKLTDWSVMDRTGVK